MALKARDILQEALKQGLLDSDGAKACVGELKASGGQKKFADVLRETGGLDNAQIRGLIAALENGDAPAPKPPRPRRYSVRPAAANWWRQA